MPVCTIKLTVPEKVFFAGDEIEGTVTTHFTQTVKDVHYIKVELIGVSRVTKTHRLRILQTTTPARPTPLETPTTHDEVHELLYAVKPVYPQPARTSDQTTSTVTQGTHLSSAFKLTIPHTTLCGGGWTKGTNTYAQSTTEKVNGPPSTEALYPLQERGAVKHQRGCALPPSFCVCVGKSACVVEYFLLVTMTSEKETVVEKVPLRISQKVVGEGGSVVDVCGELVKVERFPWVFSFFRSDLNIPEFRVVAIRPSVVQSGEEMVCRVFLLCDVHSSCECYRQRLVVTLMELTRVNAGVKGECMFTHSVQLKNDDQGWKVNMKDLRPLKEVKELNGLAQDKMLKYAMPLTDVTVKIPKMENIGGFETCNIRHSHLLRMELAFADTQRRAVDRCSWCSVSMRDLTIL